LSQLSAAPAKKTKGRPKSTAKGKSKTKAKPKQAAGKGGKKRGRDDDSGVNDRGEVIPADDGEDDT
jgi:hypothetical protein